MLSPRMQPTPYSANINYNAPPQQYLGVPNSPLGHAMDVQKHNIRENFKGNNLSASLRLDNSAADLPAIAMDQGAGQKQNFVVDRFFTAIAKSPQLKGSDYIRGDLAILPQPKPCMGQAMGIPWQSYGSQPGVVLNTGAMHVLAGANEASSTMNQLVQKITGGTNTYIGGVAQPTLPDTSVGAAMGSQVHMRGDRAIGPKSVISATAF